jgi:hypothetical protein
MKPQLKITTIALSLLASAALVTGCSGGETTQEVTPVPSVMSEEGGAEVGEVNPGNDEGLSQMLPPVIVEEDQTEVSVKVGDFLDIIAAEPDLTIIELDNMGVLSITQGYSDGSAVFNPGAQALQPGKAVITVQNPDASSREITVTVTAN